MLKKQLVWFAEEWKAFGSAVAISAFCSKAYKYGPHTDEVAYKLNQWKHKCINRSLCKKYAQVISKYEKCEDSNVKNDSKYPDRIWTIWWQGEEEAPEALKMCYQSMRKYCVGHEVVVISKDNYTSYFKLPDYIMEKVEKGNISFIHFADIIRMYLLYNYGGMWLDATLFLTDVVPDEIFHYDYYTGKLERQRMACVSEGRWNGTFFAGKPGNVFFDFMIHFYYEYWKQEQQEIDYFLIDYMTEIAYEKIPAFRKQLDMVPVNNKKIFQITPHLHRAFDQKVYDELLEETIFHKLQRRDTYKKYDVNGKETLYGYLYRLFYQS